MDEFITTVGFERMDMRATRVGDAFLSTFSRVVVKTVMT